MKIHPMARKEVRKKQLARGTRRIVATIAAVAGIVLWAVLGYGQSFSQDVSTDFIPDISPELIQELKEGIDLPFESGSTGADGALTFPGIPSGRRTGHAIAYDPLLQRSLLFGGRTHRKLHDAETWVWDATGWERMATDLSPPARYLHALATDTERREVLLFGGSTVFDTYSAETWLWRGKRWHWLNLQYTPPGRYGHAMACHAKQGHVVLFGGSTADNPYNAETWLWNGSQWSSAQPRTVPTGRHSHAMAYDIRNNQVVLFGGSTAEEPFSTDTWLWSNRNWSPPDTVTRPDGRFAHAMAYDARRNRIVLFGGSTAKHKYSRDTWLWNGRMWLRMNPARCPSGRRNHAMVYDPNLSQVVLFGGEVGPNEYSAELWLWTGEDWTPISGENQTFDMQDNVKGIWNFTSILVPDGVRVRFIKNEGNTSIRWLATENVIINGILCLDGENGREASPQLDNNAPGGPGGFSGGLGGIRHDQSGSYCGTPGQGPGGGLPGVGRGVSGGAGSFGTKGAPAELSGPSYGNAALQPLIGGSGGGGSASTDSQNGFNGGGGGGSILIASSRNIIVNGQIRAVGGTGGSGKDAFHEGGSGSGGSIHLAADRIFGSGSLKATGGSGDSWGGDGRIRLEAYFRMLAANTSPESSNSAPIDRARLVASVTEEEMALTISQIAGKRIDKAHGKHFFSPDAVFANREPITVTIEGQGIPDGVPVQLRVVHSNGAITLPKPNEPKVRLLNGKADFQVAVPRGVGSFQAMTDFTVRSATGTGILPAVAPSLLPMLEHTARIRDAPE